MADKKKHFRRRPHPRLYFRLATAAVVLLMLGGLSYIGWFIWTTVDDVVNRNDNSESIKVQGINNETLLELEKRAAERVGKANSLPPIVRDPFVAEQKVEAVTPVANPPEATTTASAPAPATPPPGTSSPEPQPRSAPESVQ